MSAASNQPHLQYRLFDFPVDSAWARKYNENLGEIRRLQVSAAILALLAAAAAVAGVLFIPDRIGGYMVAFVAGLFALGCLAMVFVIPRKMGAIDAIYARSELVPAMIANVHPHALTLVALVDLAVDRKVGSIPALVTLSCQKLPHHNRNVGEKVPCVAVAGNRSVRGKDNRYQFVSPMPIAWGTPDKGIVSEAKAQLPAREWDVVRRNLDRYEEIQTSRTRAIEVK